MAISSSNLICQEICEALGLKHVRRLDIHLAVDEIVTVKAEFYPEKDGVKQFPAILRKFQLVPCVEDVTCLGDEVGSFRLPQGTEIEDKGEAKP